MRKKHILTGCLYLTLIGLVTLLNSCASIPTPESEYDALLVFKIEHIGEKMLQSGYSYRFHMEGSSDTFLLKPDKDYAFITGLKAGTYTITGISQLVRGNYIGETPDLIKFKNPIQIVLKPGYATVFDFCFQVEVKKVNASTIRQGFSFRHLDKSEKDQILADLEEAYPDLSAWKMGKS